VKIIQKSIHYLPRQFYSIFLLVAFLIVLPLLHSGILTTIDNDLAHHVRHIYEYKLALLEGQLPPLVAPELNGSMRIPLFQYYSGTAYAFPGLISLTGIDEYTAMKLTIFLFSFLGVLSVYFALKIIIKDNQSAFVGALTFQLFTFPLIDLYIRGGFVEWMSLQFSALLFYSLLSLIQHISYKNMHFILIKFLFSVLTLVLFIPCHPIQTLYGGIVMGVLIAAYIYSQHMPRIKYASCMITISLVIILGMLLTSWFWMPILDDYHFIKVTKHVGFFPAGTNLINVLYPWFHTTYLPGFAVQLGIHITLSTLFLCILWKKINFFTKSVIILVLLLFFAVISPSYFTKSYILWLLFHPVQWSYRFLIILALVSSLAVGLAQRKLKYFLKKKHHQRLLVYSALFIIINVIPYMYSVMHSADYSKMLTSLKATDYNAYNSMASYSLSGTDYSALGWIKNGALRLNIPINIMHEGVPFETEITFSEPLDISIIANNHPLKLLSTTSNHKMVIRFIITPPVGLDKRAQFINFQSTARSARVIDYKFRAVSDKNWFKIPSSYSLSEINNIYHGVAYAKTEGLYQLPICYYSRLKINVNNALATHQSADKFFIITKLEAGKNLIVVENGSLALVKILNWLALGLITILVGLSVWTNHRETNRLYGVVEGS